MAFIDLLIHETAHKFELGNKSIAVVSALISKMNDRESGGVEGFLDQFRQAGFANTVEAWTTAAEQISITRDDVKTSLAAPLLQSLSEKTGVNEPLLSEILAFLIPPIICHLSSNQLSLTMRPDEMRKALWSGSNETDNESSFPLAKNFNQITPLTVPRAKASSLKEVRSKLLRAVQFFNF